MHRGAVRSGVDGKGIVINGSRIQVVEGYSYSWVILSNGSSLRSFAIEHMPGGAIVIQGDNSSLNSFELRYNAGAGINFNHANRNEIGIGGSGYYTNMIYGNNRSAKSALASEIQIALDGDSAWQTFENQFHQVHAGYLESVARLYPALTPTELKVCALVKINLSTKEIAQILNTEPRSIEKYRQRICKKIGLTQEDNLTSIFLAIQ